MCIPFLRGWAFLGRLILYRLLGAGLLACLGGGGSVLLTAAVGIVSHHAASLYANAVLQTLYHALGILFGHFNKGEVLHQVYASYLHLVALYVVVDEAYDFAGELSVNLSYVEEQPYISLFGGAVAALASALGLALLLCVLVLCLGDVLNFGGVGIILQEASELAAQDALDKVFLLQPFPSFGHFGQEGGNLLLVNLHAFYFVNDMIELFGADVLGFGQRALDKLFLYDALNLFYLVLFPYVYNADAGTLLAGASGTTATVGIAFCIVRHAVVDDVGKVVHVQSACGHIGGNEQLGPVLAELLVQRGVHTFEQARSFFRPSLENLHDPFLMKDMDKAVERVHQAVSTGEKILVYGDYDVDGTTAVSLVYSFLRRLTKAVDFYIPERYDEGYGVSYKGIDWASENHFGLIITLDCGIKANEKVEYAREKGIDMIICDHHLPENELPKAVAVLDPKREDCHYPFDDLSGCGVGFKLVQAYSQRYDIPFDTLIPLLDLLVVSIASDLVSVVGENRILAHFGLKQLNTNPREGLLAMVLPYNILFAAEEI